MISAILGLFGLGGSELLLVLVLVAGVIFVTVRAARKTGDARPHPGQSENP